MLIWSHSFVILYMAGCRVYLPQSGLTFRTLPCAFYFVIWCCILKRRVTILPIGPTSLTHDTWTLKEYVFSDSLSLSYPFIACHHGRVSIFVWVNPSWLHLPFSVVIGMHLANSFPSKSIKYTAYLREQLCLLERGSSAPAHNPVLPFEDIAATIPRLRILDKWDDYASTPTTAPRCRSISSSFNPLQPIENSGWSKRIENSAMHLIRVCRECGSKW